MFLCSLWWFVFASDVFAQDMCVPQGSILSVTLFAIKINSIVKSLSPGVECSLYVDDFIICYRSKFIHIIERHLQHSLNTDYRTGQTQMASNSHNLKQFVYTSVISERLMLNRCCCSMGPQSMWSNKPNSLVLFLITNFLSYPICNT